MKTTKRNLILAILSVALLISACLGIRSTSRKEPTSVPPPVPTAAPETTVVRAPTASPAVAAGSFADFRLFAREIGDALAGEDLSFFDRYARPSTWSCLGDEMVGVCKDMPADTSLEGIPVSYDWAAYRVYERESYREAWQGLFAGSAVLELAAVANRFGENPLMPMAGQSFMAIVSVAEEGKLELVVEIRVLFFEYDDREWHLAGEFVSLEQIRPWLEGTCTACYDTWAAWP